MSMLADCVLRVTRYGRFYVVSVLGLASRVHSGFRFDLLS